MSLLSKAKKFPLKPGVYMFLDAKRRVLYVGRAVSLRRRILNYFQKNLSDPRIKEMVSLARSVKYKKTDNLLDAVVLEANLIKKYWPKYNVKDKDNRSFIYIAISKRDDFPKLIIMRGRELEKILSELVNSQILKNIGISKISVRKQIKIFGPYQSLHLVKNALKIIRRIFPYSTCVPLQQKIKNLHGRVRIAKGQRPEARYSRACFDYQIGLCPGVCVGAISKKDYKKNIDNLILLLKGDKTRLIKKLKKENPEQIIALKHIQDVALAVGDKLQIPDSKFQRIEGFDVSHLTGKETYGSMVVFINGEADKSRYRLFKIKKAPINDDLRALEEMILRRFNHREWKKPDLIMIDGGRPQVSFISKILRDKNISIPLVGISKFGGDELVFPLGIKKDARELIGSNKKTLLEVREEAHRFALQANRRKRSKKLLSYAS